MLNKSKYNRVISIYKVSLIKILGLALYDTWMCTVISGNKFYDFHSQVRLENFN